MGDIEDAQEHMKVDMSDLKDQMVSMMEAMLGMKRLIESNAVTAAAKADPVLAYHLVLDIVGRGRDTLGHTNNPHLGYNQGAYPYGLPPNLTPPAVHDNMDHAAPIASKGQPPQPTGDVHEDPREGAHGDVDSYPPFPTEGLAPNALP